MDYPNVEYKGYVIEFPANPKLSGSDIVSITWNNVVVQQIYLEEIGIEDLSKHYDGVVSWGKAAIDTRIPYDDFYITHNASHTK